MTSSSRHSCHTQTGLQVSSPRTADVNQHHQHYKPISRETYHKMFIVVVVVIVYVKGKEKKSIYTVPLQSVQSQAFRHGSHSFTCKLHHACLYFVSVHQMEASTECSGEHLNDLTNGCRHVSYNGCPPPTLFLPHLISLSQELTPCIPLEVWEHRVKPPNCFSAC